MEGVKVMDDALSNLKVVKRNGKKVGVIGVSPFDFDKLRFKNDYAPCFKTW